jgi:hypothetical protein
MTVKELKAALAKVPDDVEVVSLKDGANSERTSVWDAGFNEYEEYGETVKEFIISC